METRDLVQRAVQIEKLVLLKRYDSAAAFVSELDRTNVTTERLQTRNLVKVLYRIHKTCADDGLKRAVKQLLSRWKKQCCDGDKGKSSGCGVVTMESSDTNDPDHTTRNFEGTSGKSTVELDGDPRSLTEHCDTLIPCCVAPTFCSVSSISCRVSSTICSTSLSSNVLSPAYHLSAKSTSPSILDSSALRSKCVHLLQTALTVPESSSVASQQQLESSLPVPEGSSVKSQQQQEATMVPEGSSVTSKQQQEATMVPEGSSVTSQQQQEATMVPEGSSVTSQQQQEASMVPEGSYVTSQQQQEASMVPDGSSVTSQQQQEASMVPEGSSVTSQQQRQSASLAQDIEQHIHQLHQHNLAKYKACVRTKVANLRNPRSQHLRLGLQGGWLGPGDFARMSMEEMAGEELQRQRAEFSRRGVSEHQLPAAVGGTPTRRLRCRRCGGGHCSVTQVSRGTLFLPAWARGNDPDNDAVTFVTCGGCGEQWYHSGWTCL